MSEQGRRYYADHREQHLDYARRYREANAEKIRERNRLRWATNREENNAKQRARRAASSTPPGPISEHTKHVKASLQAARRARLRDAAVERVDRLVVYERDGGICGICRKPVPIEAFHVDHIIPLVRGGEHSYRNVQVAHPRCNESKRGSLSGERAA